MADQGITLVGAIELVTDPSQGAAVEVKELDTLAAGVIAELEKSSNVKGLLSGALVLLDESLEKAMSAGKADIENRCDAEKSAAAGALLQLQTQIQKLQGGGAQRLKLLVAAMLKVLKPQVNEARAAQREKVTQLSGMYAVAAEEYAACLGSKNRDSCKNMSEWINPSRPVPVPSVDPPRQPLSMPKSPWVRPSPLSTPYEPPVRPVDPSRQPLSTPYEPPVRPVDPSRKPLPTPYEPPVRPVDPSRKRNDMHK